MHVISSHLLSFFPNVKNEMAEVYFLHILDYIRFSIIHVISNNFQSDAGVYLQYVFQSFIFVSDLEIP